VQKFEIPYLLQRMNLPEGILQRFQQAQDFVNVKANSLAESVQQVKESLQETASQATDQAINTVTTTLGNAKTSVEETFQTAGQIQNNTSTAIQTVITSSVNDWFTEHPAIFQIVKILGWAVNHPIISFIILIFALAILWNIIKLIGRLIELASLSILRVPLRIIQNLIKFIFFSFTTIGGLAIKKFLFKKKADNIVALQATNSPPVIQDKQQRIAEITQKLDAIQREQNLLLQEVAELMAMDKTDA
jgi:predicted transcriptional regulator